MFKDSVSMAFLDKRPLFHGHCLLIPLEHYETLTDLPEDLIKPIFTNAKLIAAAVKKGLKADGTFIAINNKISQSVPHLHIHIVPRRHGDKLRGFFFPRIAYHSEENAAEVQRAIVSVISELK